MDTNNSQSNDFGAALPLPAGDISSKQPADDTQAAAADVIRKRVEAAYEGEPALEVEADEIKDLGASLQRSRHQEFIYQLTGSGKSLEEIQTTWHEYYSGLTDIEKHQVWQEFYSTQAQVSRYRANVPSMAPSARYEEKYRPAPAKPTPAVPADKLLDVRDQAAKTLQTLKRSGLKDTFHSIVFGLGVGCIVLIIFLFSFFNERFIAPFIQPSREVSGTPLIGSTTAVSNAPEIIIPKINVEVPVVYGVDTIDDNAVENALESGVVHYADTAMPGQDGNLVIVGHSSNNIFNQGRYKFAFVLLSRLDNGDTFYIQKDGKRYTYQVYKKTIVAPTDVSVLGPADKPATATLITCDPPGTSTNRLVVVGEQISPDVSGNLAASGTNTLATSTAIVPGNSPTLWSRLVHSL